MMHISFWFILMMGDGTDTIKITETSINASRENGLEINAEKTKNMLLSRQQKAG
jgi:hypothetical protein